MPTALVTGCNRGLGLEFARQLLNQGNRVIATARDPKNAPELAALAATGRLELHPLEATSQSSIDALAAALKSTPIDLLINNAAVTGPDRSIEAATLDELNRILAINVSAPAALTRALLPNLRAGTRKQIVMISSQLGSITNATHGFSYGYCISKAALNMLAVKLSKELRPEGFTVVTLHPGWNRTDMGGPQAPLLPSQGVAGCLNVINTLTPKDTGRYIDHENNQLPW